MNRPETRNWLAAIAVCAMLFQALFAPGTATAPAVDLTVQLATGVVDDAPASSALVKATRPSPQRSNPDDGTQFCPYWSCGWDLGHAAGLVPIPAVEAGTPPTKQTELLWRGADAKRTARADDGHRARAPPFAA